MTKNKIMTAEELIAVLKCPVFSEVTLSAGKNKKGLICPGAIGLVEHVSDKELRLLEDYVESHQTECNKKISKLTYEITKLENKVKSLENRGNVRK